MLFASEETKIEKSIQWVWNFTTISGSAEILTKIGLTLKLIPWIVFWNLVIKSNVQIVYYSLSNWNSALNPGIESFFLAICYESYAL